MIEIGSEKLNLDDFRRIVLDNESIALNTSALQHVADNHQFLKEFSKEKIIYGINTGFGPMAQYRIEDKNKEQLQLNLIRSHCAGTGNLIGDRLIRGVLLCRLNTLLLGYSGIDTSVLQQLAFFLNHNILPAIYEHGSVGASGDLVQLAHVALCLIGEGQVKQNGIWVPTGQVFKKYELKPINIIAREGLAIINGTSAMTGIGLVNIIRARQLERLAIMASCLINEIVSSFDDHFATVLNEVKLHKGQRFIAEKMRSYLSNSQRIRKREQIYYANIPDNEIFEDKVQEYYSLRCVPQILGPISDTLIYAEEVLVNEANSVNDNPIISLENSYVYHGGNFHGDYVSLEMDKVKIAITRLSMLMERQLNFLLNDHLNQILPPFVNQGKLGLNFGLQGAQFTATSTTAENQMLSNPMYVHSISCNKDNQDIVSMGSNAALATRQVIENTYQIIAIHFLTIVTAIDYMQIRDQLAPITRTAFDTLVTYLPPVKEDKPLSATLNEAVQKLKVIELNGHD